MLATTLAAALALALAYSCSTPHIWTSTRVKPQRQPDLLVSPSAASQGPRPEKMNRPSVAVHQAPSAPVGSIYVPDRLPTSGPGLVRCGTTTCDARSERCCDGDEGTFCLRHAKPCPKFSLEYMCDETDDCERNERCCVSKRVARCTSEQCVPDIAQLCSRDDECASGECLLGGGCASANAGRVKLPRPVAGD